MLTNYSITTNKNVLKETFFLEDIEDFTVNYNTQPTQLLPVITSDNPGHCVNFHWGITGDFTKNKSVSDKLLYAPLESVQSKATLKNALMHRRCVILSDGFYGWKNIAKKESVPYRACLADNSPFAIAGIWNQFTDELEVVHHTFMMITVKTQGKLAEIVQEAPAVLNEDLLIEWLNPSTQDDSLLDFISADQHQNFKTYSVNPKLAKADFNDPSLWEKVPPANQFGNLTLFN